MLKPGIAQFVTIEQVHLLGPVGPKLRDLLHPRVLVPEQSIMDTDEVHLIMEFKVKCTIFLYIFIQPRKNKTNVKKNSVNTDSDSIVIKLGFIIF